MPGLAVFPLFLALMPATQGAQTAEPPIRQLVVTAATDSGAFANLVGLRALPGGRVLINDAARRQLTVLDSALVVHAVIADSMGVTHGYGTQAGFLLPYVADSVIFVDQSAAAFVVFDPEGRYVRTMAPPKPQDLMRIFIGYTSAQGYDPLGRLLYATVRSRGPSAPATSRLAPGATSIELRRDSTPIVRVDPALGTLDTVALVGRAVSKSITTGLEGGGSMSYSATNPLPQTDEWTLLPDGTVAVVRGMDYRIDWYHPDGTRSSSPKLPFDWRRVTLEEKQRMLDSAKVAYDTRMANAPPPPPGGRIGVGGIVLPPQPRREFVGVDPEDMPDYYPPIRVGTVRADREGNVWILPTTSRLAGAGLVYDVVNRAGEVFQRVQLPAGRNIAGFGPGGVVYLTSSAGPGQPRLERARIVR